MFTMYIQTVCDNHCKFLDISGISSTDASRAPIVTIDTQNVVPPSTPQLNIQVSCIHFFMAVVLLHVHLAFK